MIRSLLGIADQTAHTNNRRKILLRFRMFCQCELPRPGHACATECDTSTAPLSFLQLTLVEPGTVLAREAQGALGDIPIVKIERKRLPAAAILLLAQQGKLSLDDDVRKFIPELPDFGSTITIRHLIHHTSGLRDQWSLLQLAGWQYSQDLITDDDILLS